MIKSSGGYLDNVTFLNLCLGSTTFVLADSATSASAYATVIATVPVVSGAVPINVPLHVRFTNGLAINVTHSTCTIAVSYR